MRTLAITALFGTLLLGCDGEPGIRTLVLEVSGDSRGAVGETVRLEATLRMSHTESVADVSRLAIYMPEGPAVNEVLSGPTIETVDGLGGQTTVLGIERADGVPETLLDFTPGTIPFGDQTVQLTAGYECQRAGTAELYVDATFRGTEPMDTVTRRETTMVTCGGGVPDSGADDAGADGDAGAESDAGANDAGVSDAGANDAGDGSDGGPASDGG